MPLSFENEIGSYFLHCRWIQPKWIHVSNHGQQPCYCQFSPGMGEVPDVPPQNQRNTSIAWHFPVLLKDSKKARDMGVLLLQRSPPERTAKAEPEGSWLCNEPRSKVALCWAIPAPRLWASQRCTAGKAWWQAWSPSADWPPLLQPCNKYHCKKKKLKKNPQCLIFYFLNIHLNPKAETLKKSAMLS